MCPGQALFSLGSTAEIYKSCILEVKTVFVGDPLKGK